MIAVAYGAKGDMVRHVQTALMLNGYQTGPIDGIFGKMTQMALVQFQQTHLGPDRKPLTVNAIADTATLWALEHASGSDQEEELLVPAFQAEGFRRQLIDVAMAEVGVCEDPDGSNGGPRVDIYTDGWRVPWCALFISWCLRQLRPLAFPPNRQLASAWKIRAWAAAKGAWKQPTATPEPGDIFVMLKHGFDGIDAGSGHVGLVIGWDGESILTCEGNSSNAVRCRRRHAKTLTGYVLPGWDDAR